MQSKEYLQFDLYVNQSSLTGADALSKLFQNNHNNKSFHLLSSTQTGITQECFKCTRHSSKPSTSPPKQVLEPLQMERGPKIRQKIHLPSPLLPQPGETEGNRKRSHRHFILRHELATQMLEMCSQLYCTHPQIPSYI